MDCRRPSGDCFFCIPFRPGCFALRCEYVRKNTVFRTSGVAAFYSLAKEIVRQRKLKEIETTKELVDIIKSITPKKELEKKGHPAKQVFQALRIEVNKELDVLKDTLNLALNHINIGGRIVVITFNSLEDRIVKNIFNSKSKVINNRYDLLNLENPDFSLVNKKVIVASSEELENNLRAKSAKLRAIERIK